MDPSRRAGVAGFVRVLDECTLAWPDYPGNNRFNNIGNLIMDPHVGVLFVDFAAGSLLQMTGRAQPDWAPDPAPWPGWQPTLPFGGSGLSLGWMLVGTVRTLRGEPSAVQYSSLRKFSRRATFTSAKGLYLRRLILTRIGYSYEMLFRTIGSSPGHQFA